MKEKFSGLHGSRLILLPLIIAFWSTCLSPAQAQSVNAPINSGELLSQGSVLHDSGEYRKAIELYKKIDRNDTNYIRALYEIAVSYSADSQFTESIRYCQKGLALSDDPAREPDLYNQYGNALDAAGEPEQALKIFDTAISKYPAYSLLYVNKGTTLLRMKRYKESQTVLEKLLLINPYYYSAHFKLAIVNLYQGNLVPAFLGMIGYMLMDPDGRYFRTCLKILGSISHNEDEIQQYVNERKEAPSDNYQLLEQLLQAKVALNKDYRALIKLDDPISRQLQVVFEKMEYDPADPDFCMQYYVPYFKSIFTNGKFEPFVYHCFSKVNLPLIQDYVKSNKKTLTAFVQEGAAYFDAIRASRMLTYGKRNTDSVGWLYLNGVLAGRGKYRDNGKNKYGHWQYFYGAGNLQATGQYNEQGEKDGNWTYYYFNGKLKGKELYRNGIQEGEELYYFTNGEISTHSWYANGQPDGESTAYYLTGSQHTVTHHKAGKIDGKKLSYYSNGQLSYEENYKAGERNGPVISWYQSGSKEYNAAYVNGKVEGPYKKYYSDGTLMEEGTYVKDKQDGVWKYYHQNGQLKRESHIVDGKLEGDYKEFYDNGKEASTLPYKKGKTTGEARYYDRDGKLYSILLFDNDLVKFAKYFDKTGEQISSSEAAPKSIELIAYRPDGSKKSVTIYDEKGNMTGQQHYYFGSGALQETSNYENGDEVGTEIGYYPDGKKKVITTYAEGKKDGIYQIFYPHGSLQEEGWYVQNQMQGYWIDYDEQGALTDSTYYSSDDPHGYKTEYAPNGKKEFETKYRSGWQEELTQYDTMGKELVHVHFKEGTAHYKLLYPDGRTYIETNFVKGHMNGARRVFYFDGRSLLEEYYKMGQRDSIYRYYAHSGQIIREGSYKLGEKIGTWSSYFENGKLSRKETYKYGKMTGTRYDYFDDGKMDMETEFKDGEKNGPYRKFDPDGTLMFQLNYEDGVIVSYTYSGKDGQLLPPVPFPQETGKIRTLYPNGNTSAELEYKDGLMVGADNFYHPNGKPSSTSMMANNNTEGPFIVYFATGQKKAEYNYAHDNPHGPYAIYNEQGILVEQGTYYNGNLHGEVKKYDAKGALKETFIYYYGKLLSIKTK